MVLHGITPGYSAGTSTICMCNTKSRLSSCKLVIALMAAALACIHSYASDGSLRRWCSNDGAAMMVQQQ